MVKYNLTAISGTGNDTGFLTIVQGVNSELLNNFGGLMFLLGIAFVLFTSFYFTTRDSGAAALGAFFIMFVLSLGFAAINLVDIYVAWIFATCTAIAIATVWKN